MHHPAVAHLHELGAPQVEHELGVERHLMCELEAGWVVLPIVAKATGQPDECAIQPPGRIKVLFLQASVVHIRISQTRAGLRGRKALETALKPVCQGWRGINTAAAPHLLHFVRAQPCCEHRCRLLVEARYQLPKIAAICPPIRTPRHTSGQQQTAPRQVASISCCPSSSTRTLTMHANNEGTR
jgi:hypothetical protein